MSANATCWRAHGVIEQTQCLIVGRLGLGLWYALVNKISSAMRQYMGSTPLCKVGIILFCVDECQMASRAQSE